MSNINQVVLVGRLVKDAELKYTQSGTAVGNFTLAVNRFKPNEADFINCVCFGKVAENTANYTKKGSLIGVLGSIQVRNYENSEGKKVYVTEVIANDVRFMDSKGSNDNQQQQQQPAKQQQQKPVNDDPFANNGGAIDISDDDLPF